MCHIMQYSIKHQASVAKLPHGVLAFHGSQRGKSAGVAKALADHALELPPVGF